MSLWKRITPTDEKKTMEKVRAEDNSKELSIEFYPEEPKYSFDEIILPQSVKDKILDVANYAENSKKVFENFDAAFMRRISTHIEFKLPDLDCRKKIWQHYILPTMPNNIDIDELAEKYDGLSGSDISNAGITVEKHVVSEKYVKERVAAGKGVIKEVV